MLGTLGIWKLASSPGVGFEGRLGEGVRSRAIGEFVGVSVGVLDGKEEDSGGKSTPSILCRTPVQFLDLSNFPTTFPTLKAFSPSQRNLNLLPSCKDPRTRHKLCFHRKTQKEKNKRLPSYNMFPY